MGRRSQRGRGRGSEWWRLRGPLAGTTTRVRDSASEILWSPSWTPKMTKAVPSTFFPYKNLCGKESLRFSPPENLSLPHKLPLAMVKTQSPQPLISHLPSSQLALTWSFTWPLSDPSPGPHLTPHLALTQPLT